jgi:hypothetical protein
MREIKASTRALVNHLCASAGLVQRNRLGVAWSRDEIDPRESSTPVGECVAVYAVGTRHTVSFPLMQSWVSEEGVAYDTVRGIEKSNYH